MKRPNAYRRAMPSTVEPNVDGPEIVFVAPKMYSDNERPESLIARQKELHPHAVIAILPPTNAEQFILSTLEAEGRQGRTFDRIYFAAHGTLNSFNSMPHSHATHQGEVDTRQLIEGIANVQESLRAESGNPQLALTKQIFFQDCQILQNAPYADLRRYSRAAHQLGATISASTSTVYEHFADGKLAGLFYDITPDGRLVTNGHFNNYPDDVKLTTDVERSFHGLTGETAACSAQKSIEICERAQTPEAEALRGALNTLNSPQASHAEKESSAEIVLKNAQILPLRQRIGAYMFAALSTDDPQRLSRSIALWEANINQLPATERLDLLAERRDLMIMYDMDPDNHANTPLGDAMTRVSDRATSEAKGRHGPYVQKKMNDEATFFARNQIRFVPTTP